jgi:hypothetical protein
VKRHFGLPNNFLDLLTSSYTRTVNFSSPLPGNKRLRGTSYHLSFIHEISVNHISRPHTQSPLLQSRFQPRNHNPQSPHQPNNMPPPLQSQTIHFISSPLSLQHSKFHPTFPHSALTPPSPSPPIQSQRKRRRARSMRCGGGSSEEIIDKHIVDRKTFRF